ncbi:hypothetical protein HanPI659440_Chr12g0462111 [Helianthus annuus]|nr:hypothetical protein HanPI659440_Chr12g0462111 [Helianthus annuus]
MLVFYGTTLLNKRRFKISKIMITHINDHLIDLANINVLNRRMASYFTQDATISTSNNQNLRINITKTVRLQVNSCKRRRKPF